MTGTCDKNYLSKKKYFEWAITEDVNKITRFKISVLVIGHVKQNIVIICFKHTYMVVSVISL